ncbi:MAG: mechanosensitive ion channel [Rhizobiales bacterium]|nr:mechanosensitive ion channel [Hyphomicrobiales bacterium]
MRSALSAFLAALLLVLAAALPARAFDETDVARIDSSIKSSRAALASILASTDPDTISADTISQNRNALIKLKADADGTAKVLDLPQADVAAQITQLGPLPEDPTIEPPEIAQQRKQLNDRAAMLLGLRKQLELVSVEADQQLSRLSGIERDQFLSRVFAYEDSILDPRMWWSALTSAKTFVLRLGNLMGQWWKVVSPEANFSVAAVTGLFILVAGFVISRLRGLFRGMLSPSLSEPGATDPPSPVRRLWHVIFYYLQWAIGTILTLIILIVGLEAAGFVTSQFTMLFNGAMNVIMSVVLYGGAAYLVCQPTRPQARLVAIDSFAARNLVLIIVVASFIYSFGTAVTDIASSLSIPVNFAVGVSALSALTLVVLISLALVIIRREAGKDIARGAPGYLLVWFVKFTPIIWLLLVLAIAALAFGYIALGLFIAGNILESAMLAVILGVLHAFAHAVADAAASEGTRTGQLVRRTLRLTEEGLGRTILLYRTVIDIGTSVLALFGLAALWAVSLVDFTTLLRQAASGFQIGNITISPSSLLAALLILLLGIIITRYITSWLQGRVLSATKLDKGAQDSIRTSAGYAGYALAAGMALSAAGVSFSSVALIAGALGLGVGLGLQQIVTNFVSGLILLAERPIRIGDWVVTTAGEGIVKRINVRATEIETFDRSSIVIPNSNFIINPVRNWTLRDTIGHFTVPVAVSYDGNPDEVAKMLLEIASNHPKLMRHPGPDVNLVKLTPQAMEFELGGQVRNVLDAAAVSSDLRMEIVRRFGKKLLHIPSGQGAKAAK